MRKRVMSNGRGDGDDRDYRGCDEPQLPTKPSVRPGRLNSDLIRAYVAHRISPNYNTDNVPLPWLVAQIPLRAPDGWVKRHAATTLLSLGHACPSQP